MTSCIAVIYHRLPVLISKKGVNFTAARPLFPQGQTINAANKLPATVPDTHSGGFSTPVLPFFLLFFFFLFYCSSCCSFFCFFLLFFVIFCFPLSMGIFDSCPTFLSTVSLSFHFLNSLLCQLHKILVFHNSLATNVIFLFISFSFSPSSC